MLHEAGCDGVKGVSGGRALKGAAADVMPITVSVRHTISMSSNATAMKSGPVSNSA
jgi:hypothetical protein